MRQREHETKRAFKDQVAVVTGATRGIGKAIALAIAAEDATLCLVARDAAELDAVVGATGSPRVMAHRADLTNDDDIHGLGDLLQRKFGRLDILVHSHGIYLRGPVASMPLLDVDALYRANFRSTYVLTRTLLPLLKAGPGQVVFINSSIVGSVQPEVGQFAATQHALKAFADSFRQEVNPEGVRVLSVYPGRTATPRQATIHALEGKPYRPERLIQPCDVAFIVTSALKVARTAEVTDIHLRPMIKPA